MTEHIRIVTSPPGSAQLIWRTEPDVKDWDTFVTWLRDAHGHDGKHARPFVAATFDWSETTGEGQRLGAHLVERHVIQLDADKAGHDYLERLAEVPSFLRLSHTTASHMKDGKGPRWRTLVPLSRAVTPSEYLTLSNYLVDLVGRERFGVVESTSPAAVSYAPAWEGVTYDEHDGPVFDVGGYLMLAEPLEWHPTTSVPDATVEKFLADHPGTEACAYGRAALDRVAEELEAFPANDGAGFHQKIGGAGMRFVELVLAGCWSADDVDRLRDAANHRDDPRPREFDEAIAYGLGKGCGPITGCDIHGEGPFEVIIEEGAETALPGEVDLDAAERLARAQRDRERRIQAEVERLEVQAEARSRIAAREHEATDVPDLIRLDEFLEIPDVDAEYRIRGQWPTGGRVLFAAAKKTGKTTTVGNLVRSLADGDPFLGEFETVQAERIVLIDNELDARMLRRWLRDHEVQNPDRVEVLPLRGRLSTFNILDPVIRSRWAALLGSADVLIFDCLRPALDALALSEDKEAGRFLTAFDELMEEAGIPEAVMVHHMGHSNERGRGDSRILDWPDALWKLVLEAPDEPTSPRYYSAFGRDVDQAETRLGYSDFGRRLTVEGGSRKEEKSGELQAELLGYIEIHPGCNQTSMEKDIRARADVIRGTLKKLVAAKLIRIEIEGRSKKHFLVDATDV